MKLESNLNPEIFESLKKRYLDCELMAIDTNDNIFKNAIAKEIKDAEQELEKLEKQILAYKSKIKLLHEIDSKWNFELFAGKVREQHKKKWENKFMPIQFDLHYAFKKRNNDLNNDVSDSQSFSNNEHYNDQLDIDQQDPEFWNNL
jgi:hypothetical protein